MSQDKEHRERLKTLARHLDTGKLGHKRFDFNHFNRLYYWDKEAEKFSPRPGKAFAPVGCGFAGCAIGECPVVWPEAWTFAGPNPVLRTNTGDYPTTSAERWFGLSKAAIGHLFMPFEQKPARFGGKKLDGRATRKEVARNIVAFLRKTAKKR